MAAVDLCMYDVDRITDRRRRNGQFEFKIRMMDIEEEIWVPETDLDASDMKEQYQKTFEAQWIDLFGKPLSTPLCRVVAPGHQPKMLANGGLRRTRNDKSICKSFWKTNSSVWRFAAPFPIEIPGTGRRLSKTLTEAVQANIEDNINDYAPYLYNHVRDFISVLCPVLHMTKQHEQIARQLFQSVIINDTSILRDRHLHQLLICIIFAVAKTAKLPVTLRKVIEEYCETSFAASDVESVVGHAWTVQVDPQSENQSRTKYLYGFYNADFLPVVQDELRNLFLAEGQVAPEQIHQFDVISCFRRFAPWSLYDKTAFYNFSFSFFGLLGILAAAVFAGYSALPLDYQILNISFNVLICVFGCVAAYYGSRVLRRSYAAAEKDDKNLASKTCFSQIIWTALACASMVLLIFLISPAPSTKGETEAVDMLRRHVNSTCLLNNSTYPV